MISFSLRWPTELIFFDVAIGNLLQFFFALLQIIFRDQFLFLEFTQILDQIAADIAHGHAAFFGAVVDQLDQLAAAFFGEGRQVQPDDFAIVVGSQSQVGGQDGALDGFQ